MVVSIDLLEKDQVLRTMHECLYLAVVLPFQAKPSEEGVPDLGLSSRLVPTSF